MQSGGKKESISGGSLKDGVESGVNVMRIVSEKLFGEKDPFSSGDYCMIGTDGHGVSFGGKKIALS